MSEEKIKWIAEMLSTSIELDKEIERLNKIINETRDYVLSKPNGLREYRKDLLDLLDGKELKGE